MTKNPKRSWKVPRLQQNWTPPKNLRHQVKYTQLQIRLLNLQKKLMEDPHAIWDEGYDSDADAVSMKLDLSRDPDYLKQRFDLLIEYYGLLRRLYGRDRPEPEVAEPDLPFKVATLRELHHVIPTEAKSDGWIAKQLGIPEKDVQKHYRTWKERYKPAVG